MKYHEWTGDLEGNLPDIGLVSKGRVILLDTPAKVEAARPYKKSLSGLTNEEGEKRYLKQQKADQKIAETETAETAADTQPQAAPVAATPKTKGAEE